MRTEQSPPDTPLADTLAVFGGAPTRPQPIEATVAISALARQRVMELVESGKLSDYYNGPWARQFEDAFARYHGAGQRGVAVNSGTSALHLALTAAGIGPGDEVIVPALCFVAAATAVVQNGAVPIICDAEPESLTLDVEEAERLVTSRTKAVLPVHFWGYPSNAAALRDLCDRHGLTLIEDCAQAIGARSHGHVVGTFGDFAAYAFSVRKHIACGEGGMVLCRDDATCDKVRTLSNYGKGPDWDDYGSLGYSYRLAEFPAIVALDALSRLDDEIRVRQLAGRYYRELCRDTGMTVLPEPPSGTSVFFKCPVLLPPGMIESRRRMVEAIAAENVSCRVPHRPLYSVPWLADYLTRQGVYRGADDCPAVAAMHPRLIEIETGPNHPDGRSGTLWCGGDEGLASRLGDIPCVSGGDERQSRPEAARRHLRFRLGQPGQVSFDPRQTAGDPRRALRRCPDQRDHQRSSDHATQIRAGVAGQRHCCGGDQRSDGREPHRR
ncbi:MAG: DegT/DnrJ/EryC1/StrS family aminotransferase [Gemmatimonadetes bacterium]|nr:DegT/DnrJ/EryC1/StrS family aminotransferase [Gemmatimonadota bacterium]